MDPTSDLAAAEYHNVALGRWERVLAEVLRGQFGRVERLERGAIVTGCAPDCEVKTCWQLGERAGHAGRMRCSNCCTGRCGMPTPAVKT